MRAIRGDVGRDDQPLPAAHAAVGGRLIVVHPGETPLAAGEELPLEAATRLGRSSRNTIVLDDSHVSSEHATVAHRQGSWWLIDHRSTNGTLLNDHPVHEDIPLTSGDVIGLGTIRLRLIC